MTSGQAARFAALVIASASSVWGQGTAVVQGDRVNVRGGAGLSSEVVTQLRKGESVVVLEPVAVSQPGKGEPANWLKILLPDNTPVWVNANFISASNTVSAAKLNVRGGPGENYSVLARLEKGASVEPIRTVDDWIEIHPPTNAVAYVAASFLTLSGGSAAEELAPSKTPKTEPAPVVAQVKQPEATEAPSTAKVEEPVVQPTETAISEPAPVVPAPTTSGTETAAPAGNSPAETVPVVTPPVEPARSVPVEAAPAAQRKRIVVREGILRRDFHINTPGYFQLVDKYHERLINYLYVSNPELDLSPFVGSVVIVRGEEYLDERWKRTPVIEVEHATLPN